MGEIARRIAASLGLDRSLEADEDALTRFLRGQAGLIGPLNPALARWLRLTAQKEGLSPLLLPVPFLEPAPVVDIAAVSVALFRQTAFRGHRHTRAAAEMAAKRASWEYTLLPVRLRLLAGELSPSDFAALAYTALSDLEKQ